tara:strand:- start:846 stop:1145 length:300 start_codon:yes stop_codon:yes gene_type:complete
MALASKRSAEIHDKTGSDLTEMTNAYNADKHHNLIAFPSEAALMHQMELMQDDIDELRRYIVSAELLLPNTMGDSLPTVDPRSAGQLWNNNGVLSVSRG